jgi:hypothetical protein
MRAIIVNCTLKPTPMPSNTESLALILIAELESHGVETELIRAVDYDFKPGVQSDKNRTDRVAVYGSIDLARISVASSMRAHWALWWIL